MADKSALPVPGKMFQQKYSNYLQSRVQTGLLKINPLN